MNVAVRRPLPPDRISSDDFEDMLFERPDDEKWELIDGRIIKSVVGASWEHHHIIRNCDFAIYALLRAKGSA